MCLVIPAFFFACKKADEGGEYKSEIIVEGWIEQNDYPYVFLTRNLPFFTSVDSAQLAQMVIRYAKVSVTDGINTEVLTGKIDNRYFPYFLYRGTSLKGEIGKTYKLTIEYAGNTLTAETSIPKPLKLDSIWFIQKDNQHLQLSVRFQDNINEKNYYKLYTKSDTDARFTPTLLSNQDDKYFNGKTLELQINRGPANNMTSKYDAYFLYGDTVLVKFATLPQSGFEFWNSFQNEVLNASNPLIGSTNALKTNIDGPGAGIWCGYGVTVYRVIAKP